jgi:hypothetical protein
VFQQTLQWPSSVSLEALRAYIDLAVSGESDVKPWLDKTERVTIQYETITMKMETVILVETLANILRGNNRNNVTYVPALIKTLLLL